MIGELLATVKMRVKSFITLPAFIIFMPSISISQDSHSDVFCSSDEVRINCSDGRQMLVTSATYRRSESGLCGSVVVEDENEQLESNNECAIDVLDIMSSSCSGRHRCRYSLSNLDSDDNRERWTKIGCNPASNSYLNLTHSCIKVEGGEAVACNAGNRTQLSGDRGYINGRSILENRSGTSACPWSISAKHDQRINVILRDFTPRDMASGTCNVKFIFQDKNITKTIGICDAKEDAILYTSTNNTLSFHLAEIANEDIGYFLLEYQAVSVVLPTAGTTRTTSRTHQGHGAPKKEKEEELHQIWVVLIMVGSIITVTTLIMLINHWCGECQRKKKAKEAGLYVGMEKV